MSVLTRYGVIVTNEIASGWRVTSIECRGGLVRTLSNRGLVEIVVADTALSDTSGAQPCFAAAACTTDGDAMVLSRPGAPAFVASGGHVRSIETDTTAPDLSRLASGDRIILLSPAARQNLSPRSMSRLRRDPTVPLPFDAEELLVDLFDTVEEGAAAVLDRCD